MLSSGTMILALDFIIFPSFEIPVLACFSLLGGLSLFIGIKSCVWQRRVAALVLVISTTYIMCMSSFMLSALANHLFYNLKEQVNPDPLAIYRMLCGNAFRISVYCMAVIPSILIPALILVWSRNNSTNEGKSGKGAVSIF